MPPRCAEIFHGWPLTLLFIRFVELASLRKHYYAYAEFYFTI